MIVSLSCIVAIQSSVVAVVFTITLPTTSGILFIYTGTDADVYTLILSLSANAKKKLSFISDKFALKVVFEIFLELNETSK